MSQRCQSLTTDGVSVFDSKGNQIGEIIETAVNGLGPGQWVDPSATIDGLPEGDCTIQVALNFKQEVAESDASNNISTLRPELVS